MMRRDSGGVSSRGARAVLMKLPELNSFDDREAKPQDSRSQNGGLHNDEFHQSDR